MADVAASFLSIPDFTFNVDVDTGGAVDASFLSIPDFTFDTDPLNLLGATPATFFANFPSSGYINRVYDSVAVKVVNWRTEIPDPTGVYYPGPGVFGVTTSDYVVVKKVFS